MVVCGMAGQSLIFVLKVMRNFTEKGTSKGNEDTFNTEFDKSVELATPKCNKFYSFYFEMKSKRKLNLKRISVTLKNHLLYFCIEQVKL